jgi:hypothetical protein
MCQYLSELLRHKESENYDGAALSSSHREKFSKTLSGEYTLHMKTRMVALIIAGITIWIMTAIIGLLMNASAKFIWTCITGATLGIVGIIYTIRRDRRSGI